MRMLSMKLCVFAVLGFGLLAQPVLGQELFSDDFSGDLSNWMQAGNEGAPGIAEGQLALTYGFAPSWFLTNQTFAFGETGLRFDFRFMGGGNQQSANFKTVSILPLLGATGPQTDNGAVRASFGFNNTFTLARRVLSDGEAAWEDIALAGDGVQFQDGSRIRIEIRPDGINGDFLIDGQVVEMFTFLGAPFEGGVGFRSIVGRNQRIDDVRFFQIAQDGTEEVILEDDFERDTLGDAWAVEGFNDARDAAALDVRLENGALVLEHDGSTNDTWVRTAEQVDFSGSTTVFEFTVVERFGDTSNNPEPVIGTKPFTPGETTGTLLFDVTPSGDPNITVALVDGAWQSGQAQPLGVAQEGSIIRYITGPSARTGRIEVDGVQAGEWVALGQPISGGVGFRNIVGRNFEADNIRVYSVDANGNETTLFEDDFEREALGADWVPEDLTVGAVPGALFPFIDSGKLVIDHDGSLDDTWLRTSQSFPFGETTVVFEFQLITRFGDGANSSANPAIVLGTQEFVPNETIGPLLVDGPNSNSIFRMDAREGNVWVGGGPLAGEEGTEISLQVNPGGTSGQFLNEGVVIQRWQFAEGEAPIAAGSVGFSDTNEGEVQVFFDDVRVSQVEGTPVRQWSIY